MKFQKIEAFEKHFKASFPKNLSGIYIAVCPKEGEGKKLFSSLFSLMAQDSDFKKCATLKEAIGHLREGSLFFPLAVAMVEEVEEEIELLTSYLSQIPSKAYLLIGAKNFKPFAELYAKGKKDMTVLDLSEEKPWEEKQRLQKEAVEYLHSQHKKISPSALEFFFTNLPLDSLLLQHELHKLLSYIGEKEEIVIEDVKAICAFGLEQNVFQIAQNLIWHDKLEDFETEETSFFLMLIGALRTQLEIGLKISAFLQRNVVQEEIAKAFPKLWPKTFLLCLEKTKQKGMNFFQKGLLSLFELELGLKTGETLPSALFILFCARL